MGLARVVTQRGFTIIELMLVLVVIGVMFSMAALVLPHRIEMELEQEAVRLVRVLNALQREALLQASPAGLRITDDGYETSWLNLLTMEWELNESRLLSVRDLASRGMLLKRVERKAAAVAGPDREWPAVVFDAAGVSEPFVMELALSDHGGQTVTLVGDGVNEVLLQ